MPAALLGAAGVLAANAMPVQGLAGLLILVVAFAVAYALCMWFANVDGAEHELAFGIIRGGR